MAQRLIDAEALAEKLETLATRYKAMGNTELSEDYLFILRILGHVPTVDAVPIVRCRDCKWDRPDTLLNKHWYSRFCGSMEVRGDDFCSYGARKEDKP